MAIKPTQAVAVSTTAVRLDADETDTVSGKGIFLVWQDSGTVVLGDAAVTAITGVRVPVTAGMQMTFELDPGEKLYAITASGTVHVDILGMGE